MSLKHYGIYLAYAPTVDLRHQGLGRYLAAFVKGAAARDDLRLVLVCPSWSREALQELLASEGVAKDRITISSPKGKPLVLRAYESYRAYKERPRASSLRLGILKWTRKLRDAYLKRTEQRLVQAHTLLTLLPFLLDIAFLAVLALILSPLILIVIIAFLLGLVARRGLNRVSRPIRAFLNRIRAALGQPEDDSLVLRLYQRMEEVEAKRMLSLIGDFDHVLAWYCPTAFWPAFNEIRAPKLMCVPDVVLAEFSVGFCDIGGDRFLASYKAVESAIQSGQYFVTYSEDVKWTTLVGRYAVRAANVTVIGHAPNDLSRWVTISGFDNVEATSRHYCQWLMGCAVRKSSNPGYSNNFREGSFKFIIYASQFRPNKNLIALLKAYEYLLRKRFIGHKLILTGTPNAWPPVQQFIHRHNLENDVLCLHRLPIQELAACYKLADLAVNPSLSEGGCPFTFTEALSVDTPVVMARIAVSEEVLIDPELQEMTFFDPYDWEDMAYRIEWGLAHRDELLSVQRRTYNELAKRNWTDVVNEHIEVLDRISVSSNCVLTKSRNQSTQVLVH